MGDGGQGTGRLAGERSALLTICPRKDVSGARCLTTEWGDEARWCSWLLSWTDDDVEKDMSTSLPCTCAADGTEMGVMLN